MKEPGAGGCGRHPGATGPLNGFLRFIVDRYPNGAAIRLVPSAGRLPY
ncbi:MAG: hypothetical protein WBE59_13500 [Candidatus Cybelea sp.]